MRIDKDAEEPDKGPAVESGEPSVTGLDGPELGDVELSRPAPGQTLDVIPIILPAEPPPPEGGGEVLPAVPPEPSITPINLPAEPPPPEGGDVEEPD